MKLTSEQKALVGPWIELERNNQALNKKELRLRAGVGSPATYERLINPEDSVETSQVTVEAFMVALGYTPDSWRLVAEGQDPVASSEVPPGQREDVLLAEIRDMNERITRIEEAALSLTEALGELIGLDALRRIQEARTSIKGG